MKRNGMCPICYLKRFFTRPQKVSTFKVKDNYDEINAPTPPMGWSSWNTFRNNIDEDLIYDTAKAMVDKGLAKAGYKYINLDDCWQSNLRDENGDLQGDLVRFRHGIAHLISKINDLGLKVGLYTSNGTLTCEDLPASLGNEEKDAKILAKWGCEYFKYDFCHNIPVPTYAPLVYSITVSKDGVSTEYPCTDAVLEGLAKLMPDNKVNCNKHISGLDAGLGKATFNNVYVEEDGEYVLTINIRKKGEYQKFLQAEINEDKSYYYEIPDQKFFNNTARFQQQVSLKKGINKITLSNPISNRADSTFYQYHKMGQALKKATEGKKPIVFSICEWGVNKPYMWGGKAGNLWRTTPDIRPIWPWIKIIYDKTVKLYKYSRKGAYNDPDMLEVGNGKLTFNQNRSHFSLWCMMNAPLVLGNDLRSIPQNVLDIVTNKQLIAINQDSLSKAAKRVKKGLVDVLAKPLSEDKVAICFFNRGKIKKSASYNVEKLVDDEYVQLLKAKSYKMYDAWEDKEVDFDSNINVKLDSYESKVFIITPVK